MLKIPVYNLGAEKVGEQELNDKIFAKVVSEKLLDRLLGISLTKKRRAIAHTKNRGEVSATGKKPWKQKGTGRARVGSSGSPLWIGGGIAWGPRNDRNFFRRANKKMRKSAFAMIFGDYIAKEKLFVLDSLADFPKKTKEAAAFFKKLTGGAKKVLFIINNEQLEVAPSVVNIKGLELVLAGKMGINTAMSYDVVVISKAALMELEKSLEYTKKTKLPEKVKVK